MTSTTTTKQLNEQYKNTYIYCKVIKEKLDNFQNQMLMVNVLKNKNSPFKLWGEEDSMCSVKQRLTSTKEDNGTFTRLTEDGKYYRFLVSSMGTHMGHKYIKTMQITPLPKNIVDKYVVEEVVEPVDFSDSEED